VHIESRIDCNTAKVSRSSRTGHSTDDDDLLLRVEIREALGAPGHLSARLWRLEHYRIQATFPQTDGSPSHQPSDELILKEFAGRDSPLENPRSFVDAVAALDFVFDALAR
jgi:hypothetical protein